MSPVFDVPTLARVLAEPAGDRGLAVYVNGELRHAGMVVSCPGCHNVISPEAVVDDDWCCEPIRTFIDYHLFQHYEPGPVEVTVWHVGHKPD